MGARVIKSEGVIKEGELFNKWIYQRMIKRNKNVLTACTGPTGSGKSYGDLRRFELWYEYYFHKPAPIENVCFSVAELMGRLSSDELKKGDLLILEEAGANLGSLDFQNKIAKMFNYVLQSFRSLNIGIFFNLPYLTMLNKQARMLIHAQFITSGIDVENKKGKYKAFFLQTNQQSGKVYTKYLRIKKGGMYVPVKRFAYGLPSEELMEKYEAKKFKFVSNLTKGFSEELKKIEADSLNKIGRKEMSPQGKEVWKLLDKEKTPREIGEEMECSTRNVWSIINTWTKNGYEIPEYANLKRNRKKRRRKPTPST